jgi:hypothetical protein
MLDQFPNIIKYLVTRKSVVVKLQSLSSFTLLAQAQ